MNLTTTQISLLREAATHYLGCVFVERSVGRGPMGGAVNTGKRLADAAQALRAAGLFRLDNTSTSALPRNGFTVDTTCACFEITDAGRAALAMLAQAA